MLRIAKALASGLYSGYAPIAPATIATGAVAIVYFVTPVPNASIQLLGIVFLFLVGVRLCSLVEPVWGVDSRRIVIDEIVGFLIALSLLPKSLMTLSIAFVLFRFFDILKPPPIRQSERLPGGWGVMADDLLSGVCTNLCLRLYLWLWG